MKKRGQKAFTGKHEIVIATRNKGKFREIAEILSPLHLTFLSLRDFPDLPAVVEDGATFVENAAKKAIETARATGHPAIADDSGLVVDALGGRPGVLSARYAGEDATDMQRCEKLLQEMAGVPAGNRQAAFICAAAVASPEGQVRVVEGECRGVITRYPKGNYGFGYDPVFFVPDFGKTMAELPPDVKNRISHRARAFEKLRDILLGFIQE